MLLIFVGPPGSGKGTMASMLKDYYNFETFSIGDALREEVKKGTELGKIIDSYISKGDLVPDDIATQIIQSNLDADKNFILDGYPRNINQAHLLDNILKNINKKIDRVLYFNVDDEILVDRIANRLVCPKCNRIYHKKVQKPQRLWYCDFDGTELVQRKDDNEEALRERLKVYHEITKPVIDYYMEKDLVSEVSGDFPTIEERFEVVKKILNLSEVAS